jgi:hypothetical protein
MGIGILCLISVSFQKAHLFQGDLTEMSSCMSEK